MIRCTGVALLSLRSFRPRFSPGGAFGRLILCVLLPAVNVQQCQSQSIPEATDLSSNVSGTVVNSVTREPIGRALVYTTDQQAAAFTDDHGHFEFPLAKSPSRSDGRATTDSVVVLEARKPGFLPPPRSQGQPVDLREHKDVTIALIPEGLIVGRVKFPSAEAGDQVQVRLYRREVRDGAAQWAPLTEVPTRANGEFRFADLRAGEYKLFTREALERDPLTRSAKGPVFGFPPRFFANARDFAGADMIRVRAGESVTADLALVRERYYDVKVAVIAPEPGGLGVEVSVHAQGHRGPGYDLGYDPDQHAIVGSLPNGTYTVEAFTERPAAASGMSSITVANAVVNAPPITLTPHQSVPVNVRQELTGTERAPMQPPSVYVSLQPAEEVATDRWGSGSYQGSSSERVLPGVKPGRYWIQVQSQGSGMYIASVTAGGKDLTRTPLVVPFGASVPTLEIVVRNDTGQINATIDGAKAQPNSFAGAGTMHSEAPGPHLYCIPATGGGAQPREFFPAHEGNFVFSDLPPGDYRILAFDEPQEFEYRNPEAMRAYESMGQVVHLSAGEKLQVQLKPARSQ